MSLNVRTFKLAKDIKYTYWQLVQQDFSIPIVIKSCLTMTKHFAKIETVTTRKTKLKYLENGMIVLL